MYDGEDCRIEEERTHGDGTLFQHSQTRERIQRVVNKSGHPSRPFSENKFNIIRPHGGICR